MPSPTVTTTTVLDQNLTGFVGMPLRVTLNETRVTLSEPRLTSAPRDQPPMSILTSIREIDIVAPSPNDTPLKFKINGAARLAVARDLLAAGALVHVFNDHSAILAANGQDLSLGTGTQWPSRWGFDARGARVRYHLSSGRVFTAGDAQPETEPLPAPAYRITPLPQVDIPARAIDDIRTLTITAPASNDKYVEVVIENHNALRFLREMEAPSINVHSGDRSVRLQGIQNGNRRCIVISDQDAYPYIRIDWRTGRWGDAPHANVDVETHSRGTYRASATAPAARGVLFSSPRNTESQTVLAAPTPRPWLIQNHNPQRLVAVNESDHDNSRPLVAMFDAGTPEQGRANAAFTLRVVNGHDETMSLMGDVLAYCKDRTGNKRDLIQRVEAWLRTMNAPLTRSRNTRRDE